jgi:hypothetical protein
MEHMEKNKNFKSNLDAVKWLEKKIYYTSPSGKNILRLLEYKGKSLFFVIFAPIVFQLKDSVITFEKNASTQKNPKVVNGLREMNLVILEVLGKLVYLIEQRKKTTKRRILCFTNSGGWRPLMSKFGDMKKTGDHNYCRLLDDITEVNDDFELVTVAPIGKINDKTSIIELMKRIFIQNQRHIPLEAFLSNNVKNDVTSYGNEFSKRWTNLNSHDDYFNEKIFESKKNANIIKSYLEGFANGYYYGTIKNIELCIKVIEKETPDLIIITHNGGIYWKGIIFAAKLKGIKVISLQHALMLENDIGYYRFKPKGKLPDFTPERMAVYGKESKEFLTKYFNYPKKAMTLVGAYTYDSLFQFEKKFNKRKYLESLQLDPLKKTIFFAAQFRFPPFKEMDEIVIKELKKIDKQFNIIVKPHPRGNYEEYTKLIKKSNLKAVLLESPTLSFFPILSSDMIISFPSSIIFESTLFGKKSILLDVEIGGKKAFWNNERSVIKAKNSKELNKALTKLLSAKENQSRHKANISRLVYKTDGNTFQRILRLFEREVKA